MKYHVLTNMYSHLEIIILIISEYTQAVTLYIQYNTLLQYAVYRLLNAYDQYRQNAFELLNVGLL